MEYSEDIKSKCCIPYFETNAGGKRSKAGRIRTTKMLKFLCQSNGCCGSKSFARKRLVGSMQIHILDI